MTVTNSKSNSFQIVILSRPFLDWVFRYPSLVIGNLFKNPSRVIGLLLGVDGSNILSEHKSTLVTFQNWFQVIKITDLNQERSQNQTLTDGQADHELNPELPRQDLNQHLSKDSIISNYSKVNKSPKGSSVTNGSTGSSKSQQNFTSFLNGQISEAIPDSKSGEESSDPISVSLNLDAKADPINQSTSDSETFLLKLHRSSVEILSQKKGAPSPPMSCGKCFQIWPTTVEMVKPSARVLLILSSEVAAGKFNVLYQNFLEEWKKWWRIASTEL